MSRFSFLFLFLFGASQAFSQTLSEVETFYRCYGHLTNKRLQRSHPLLADVKAGNLSGPQACERVLVKALLNQNGRLINENNLEARAVIKSMTKLHMTFFERQSLADVNAVFANVSNDIYDDQASALHYTKALFDESFSLDRMMQGASDIEGVRTSGALTSRGCLLYTSPSPRDQRGSRMPSSA